MYSAETTIVDVKQTGESEYTLSMTAKDLYVAAQSGDVLRRHDVSESDKAPEKKYVALSGVKFAEATGKYTFTFASGDVFESASDTAYPTAESVIDETGGGSGGGSGIEVVQFELRIVFGGTPSVSCDHTIDEIDAARETGKLIIGLIGFPKQMTYVEYSGDDDYPYSAVFYAHEINGDSLTVTKHGFFYEEGAWVYSSSSINLTGNA